MTFIESIQATLKQHALIEAKKPVIVGVSGGADSVALLRALHQLGVAPLKVAHVNHQLRGDAANADEEFVKTLADELGLPFFATRINVKTLSEAKGVSLEMAARDARHDFFRQFGEEAAIALAHHADDQAETFLLKLARGAGPDGLSGMGFTQSLDRLRIIRPLLNLPRAEIVDWLTQNEFRWREDASNQSADFLRNRVRNEILPMLAEQLNPNIRETMRRTMDILREENEWLDAEVNKRYASCCEDARLIAEALLAHPLAAQRRMVRRWLFDAGVESISFDAVEKVLSLAATTNGSLTFELSDQQRVVFEYGRLRLESEIPEPKTDWKLTIELGTGWKTDHGRGAGILPAEASFNAAKVGDSPITVRSLLPGDRIRPFGMSGSCKLQDLFTDQKIPRAQRSSVPIVICRDEIIWIPGYRTAQGWEVEGKTGDAIHVHIA